MIGYIDNLKPHFKHKDFSIFDFLIYFHWELKPPWCTHEK